MKKIVLSFFLMVILVDASTAQESKFKALFINKFVQYIEWPSNEVQVIGVFGKSKVFDELSEIAKNHDHFKVIQIFEVSEYEKCDLIYLPQYMNFFTPQFKELIGGKSILVISDVKEQAGESADIGFYISDQRLLFNIDTKSITAKKMTASPRIVNLGHKV